MTDWKAQAAATKLPVFPVRITWAGGRWQKKPLVADWVNVASYKVDDFDWSAAIGYGIAMGRKSGLYAFDLDDYKEGCEAEQWLEAHGLHFPTRTHQTISGGRHLIFSLSGKWKDLRSRANIVPGLDSRGEGGFIAFGPQYEIVDDRFPALLPHAVCEAVSAGHSAMTAMTKGLTLETVDKPVLKARVKRLIDGNRTLRRRWRGDAGGIGSRGKGYITAKDLAAAWAEGRQIGDRTASGMDLSVARLLATAGLTYSEIVAALQWFRFGKWHNSAQGETDATRRSSLAGSPGRKHQGNTPTTRSTRTEQSTGTRSRTRISVSSGPTKTRCTDIAVGNHVPNQYNHCLGQGPSRYRHGASPVRDNALMIALAQHLVSYMTTEHVGAEDIVYRRIDLAERVVAETSVSITYAKGMVRVERRSA